MTEDKPKRKRGKPSWIPPPSAQVESIAARCRTQEGIARALRISPATLYKKKRYFAEFEEAIKNGQADLEVAVADRLISDALAGGFPQQAFYLERKCGWLKPVDSEAPSDAARGGLSSDLVAVLRQALLGELQQQIEQTPERPAIEATARSVKAPGDGITDIALRRAELLGANGKGSKE